MTYRPPEPFRPGQPVRELRRPLNDLVESVQHILTNFIQSGPGIFINKLGSHIVISSRPSAPARGGPPPGPLQVSTQRPPGATAPWDNDEDPEFTPPLHVWVWWGLVENIVPDNIGEPLAINLADADANEDVFVYVSAVPAKIIGEGPGGTNLAIGIESVTLKTSEGGQPVQAPPDLQTGEPPEELIYILARVNVDTAENSIRFISNTGIGSLGCYIYTQDYAVLPATVNSPGGIRAIRHYNFYRT